MFRWFSDCVRTRSSSDCVKTRDTTGFSRVEVRLEPNESQKDGHRYHRLQPHGVSISTFQVSFFRAI